MDLQTIKSELTRKQQEYSEAVGKKKHLERQLQQTDDQLQEVIHNIGVWRQTQTLLSKVSEYARAQLKTRIEETVTAALQAVVDETMQFKIEIGESGGKATAEWRVVSSFGGNEVSRSPEAGRGGGVSDIVSLALRLALLELSRPKIGGPVILDEPGKHVSREYLPYLAEFLREYAQQTGRQVIMVTHHGVLADVADKGYRVEKNSEGESVVSEV